MMRATRRATMGHSTSRCAGRLPLAWLAAACALLVAALGCGGLPPVSDTEDAGAVVVLVFEAETNAALQVPATVIVGGVRGVLNPEDQQLVLRNVPLGTGTPPTQPMTVSAEGYQTYVQQVQLNITTATWVQVNIQPADTATTGTISGAVTNEVSGEPVTSAFVQFTPPGQSEPAVAGYTDNTGAFTVGGIPAGARDVIVQAAGYLPFEGSVTVRADDLGSNPDLSVTLIGGDTAVRVTGVVVDVLTREPIAGAEVTVGDHEPVTTGADGRFEVADVLVGEQQITVTAPEYDDFDVTTIVLPGMGDLIIEMFERAQEPPTEPYTIAGTVTLNGPPDSSGATVLAVDLTTADVRDEQVTGPSGRYGLFVPPGRYEVVVVFGERRLSREITVPPGGVAIDGINFVLTVQ